MNDSELNDKLRSAREPQWDAEYQADFPRQVLARLRSLPPVRGESARHAWLPRLVWAGAAVVCLCIAFAAGHWQGRHQTVAAGRNLLENTKLIRETLALFPHQVRAIVQDEHGLKLVLSETANIPSSPPLFVQICDGKTCSSVVTFSGQDVQIAGRTVTVLADAEGGVILESAQFAWSSASHDAPVGGLKITARPLTADAL